MKKLFLLFFIGQAIILVGSNTNQLSRKSDLIEIENFIKSLDAGTNDLLLTEDEKARKEDSIDPTGPIYSTSQNLDDTDELEESDDDYDDNDEEDDR